jgi:phage terminase large subunit-like protein
VSAAATPQYDVDALRQQLLEREAIEKTWRLLTYTPYDKQADFHRLGKDHGERMLSGGNQLGKTWSGGAEVAFHATGIYPEWWEGQTFDRPTRGWVSGISGEQTRDNAQRMLYGPEEAPGTGMIPADRIVKVSWSRHFNNLIDTMIVRHKAGGHSHINFKSYEMGRKKFQGETLDYIWLDEEPPEDIYTEVLARMTKNRESARCFITFTPLLGATNVVNYFYPEPNSKDRALVRLEIEDAKHVPADQREKIIAGYPLHEREARARGIPMLGSGRVFPVLEELITCTPFRLPEHFRRIVGIDFGWDHPTAAAWLAFDPESGTIYVTDDYRQREETPIVHAAAIRSRSDWALPVAWPHDGEIADKGSGISLAVQYDEQGLRMMPEHATFEDGGFGVEAGVTKMLDLMKTGKWRVFRNCHNWLEEFRMYHREEGKIVKKMDDTLCASRYAYMMLRHAMNAPETTVHQTHAGLDYSPLYT